MLILKFLHEIDPNMTEEISANSLYVNEFSNHPLLTSQREVELIERSQKGDDSALDELTRANQRLIIQEANRFMGYAGNLERMDLIQRGNEGLIEAIKKFDTSRGYRLSTYAMWFIRRNIRREALRYGRTLTISTFASERIPMIESAKKRLKESLGREPSIEEISSEVGISQEIVRDITAAYQVSESIDQEINLGEHNDFSISEVIHDPSQTMDIETMIARKETIEAIRLILGKMDERPRQTIILLFGLNGEEPKTIIETAKELGVSRGMVFEWKRRALSDLRSYLNFLQRKQLCK